jgi:hypothetical protein
LKRLKRSRLKKKSAKSARKLNSLTDRIVARGTKNSDMDASVAHYSPRIQKRLRKQRKYMLNRNVILREAWDRSASGAAGDYKKSGKRFAKSLTNVLLEISKSDPSLAHLTGKIDTGYINKHHVLLKSHYPAHQTDSANLLHAGIGVKGNENTDHHKAMHRLTSLAAGKVDFSNIHPAMKPFLVAEHAHLVKHPAHLK